MTDKIMTDKLTNIEKCNLRLECAKLVVSNASKYDIERDICIDKAKQVYRFVIGTPDNSAPKTKKNKTG